MTLNYCSNNWMHKANILLVLVATNPSAWSWAIRSQNGWMQSKSKSKSIQSYLLAANKRRCTASECEIVLTALIQVIITLCTHWHEFIPNTVHDTTSSELCQWHGQPWKPYVEGGGTEAEADPRQLLAFTIYYRNWRLFQKSLAPQPLQSKFLLQGIL